jgi:hypothetical protein
LRSARERIAALVLASLVGVAAFGWPLLLQPTSPLAQTTDTPLLFALLLPLLLAVVLAELADGGMDAKAIAMLGVLSAVGAALRPLGHRHRRVRAGVLPAGPRRPGVRARVRVRAGRHDPVRLGAGDRPGSGRGCRSRCSVPRGWEPAPACCRRPADAPSWSCSPATRWSPGCSTGCC